MLFCLTLSKRCRFLQINKTTPFATKSSAGAFLSAHALSGSIQVFIFPLKNHPWGWFFNGAGNGVRTKQPESLIQPCFLTLSLTFQANASQFASHFNRFNHNNTIFLIVNDFSARFLNFCSPNRQKSSQFFRPRIKKFLGNSNS